MSNESINPFQDVSGTKYCLIEPPVGVVVLTSENETDRTISHQNWLSTIGKNVPYISEIDSGDIINIKLRFNRYARVYYTLATSECTIKNEWIEAINQYQGYVDDTRWVVYENTIAGYLDEDQPEIHQITLAVDEPAFLPEFYYNQNVHALQDVKAIIYERIDASQCFTAVLSDRNIETREEIYKIELQMFENFPHGNFRFSVRCIPNKSDIDSYIKTKNLLYYKE
jgi:hypothetical protein